MHIIDARCFSGSEIELTWHGSDFFCFLLHQLLTTSLKHFNNFSMKTGYYIEAVSLKVFNTFNLCTNLANNPILFKLITLKLNQDNPGPCNVFNMCSCFLAFFAFNSILRSSTYGH